jgi:hypothetical protein
LRLGRLLRKIGGCLAENVLLQLQFGDPAAQPTQLLTLIRAQLVGLATAGGTLGDADPAAQGLMVDTKLTGDLP